MRLVALAWVVAGALIASCTGEIRLVSGESVVDGGTDAADSRPVGCSSDDGCNGGLHCDVPSHSCVACIVDAHCTSEDRRRCDAALHRCVQCGLASDCESDQQCEPETRTCVWSCRDGGACPSDAPICDPSRAICLQCRANTDCHEDDRALCDTARGLCVACRSDADCPSTRPTCTPDGSECATL